MVRGVLRHAEAQIKRQLSVESCRFILCNPNTIDAVLKPKSKPSEAGSIWKGGARERADVFFAKENVCLEVDACGNAIFTDANGTEIYRDKADGQGRYFFEACCKVKDGVISVRFPIQEVVDHYPNCDGEYDRYSYITRDNVVIDYKL